MTHHTAVEPLRVLLLPGWLDSGPGHWQTHWEAAHGCERVQQADWVWPRRGDWMARLDDVLMADERPAALVAHSLGCHLVAAWAAHSRQLHRVTLALLVAPPDLDRPDLPPQVATWRPTLRQPLPMPATLAYSDDDPYCSADAARQLAADWRVPAWPLGPRGHVNADSGLADWPEAWQHLQQRIAATR